MTDVLDTMLQRTGAALGAAPTTERWCWHFARCWLLVTRILTRDDADHRLHAEVDTALADFAALPPQAPGRGDLAAHLAAAFVGRGLLQDLARSRQTDDLVAAVPADRSPVADWPQIRAVIRATNLMHRAVPGQGGLTPRTALAELDELATVVDDRRPYVIMIELARLSLESLRVQQDRDFAGMEEVARRAERIAGRYDDDPTLAPQAAIMAVAMRTIVAIQRGDLAAAEIGLTKIEGLRDRLSADNPMRAQAEQILAQLRPAIEQLRAMRGEGPMPSDSLDRLRALAGQPGLDPAERASRYAALGVAEIGAGPAMADVAVDDLRAAVATAPADDANRAFYLLSLGGALLSRYETRRVRPDLDEAISVLVRARAAVETPAHALWPTVSQPLAHAYHLAGRAVIGREIALDGLRGHAWSVLLQADTAAATSAARDAAGEALDVARWCLTGDDPAAAATALDAGRGLILFSAIERRAITQRLEEHGDRGLADRWRAATRGADADAVPVDLRREVLSALTGVPLDRVGTASGRIGRTGGTAGLLEPPSRPEVQEALRRLDLDALVYLMPGDGGVGAAVIVPSDGRPSWIPLQGLGGYDPHALRAALVGGAGRGTARSGATDRMRDVGRRLDRSLTDVCDWAGAAVVRPLLTRLGRPAGRPPRIGLVPMRELALVPWHAARWTVAGRPRLAVEEALFSYVPSARLLCETAAADPARMTRGGLVVGDPDTRGAEVDLPAARAEAVAIREVFYPRATYVGRGRDGGTGPDGAGTPDEVMRWLGKPSGGAVLHLACHASVARTAQLDVSTVDTADESAYLLLHGGDTLSAERIVTALSGAGRQVALVVLAACNTGVGERGGYDEAFSLAASFLASGASTVVGSMWSVPDGATSVLMFMVHHFIARGQPAREALRTAQLWMLDPNRTIPDTLPADLRQHVARTDPADVLSWAGFVHTGR